MKEIINLLARSLTKRCKEQMDIQLTLSNSLKEHLVERYSDNKMGARPLRRAIQSVVEDALAEEILRKNVTAGDTVTAGYKADKKTGQGEVTFTVKNNR